MHKVTSLFSGKKITQMGLGLLGRGIGDAAFLARNGAELMVTDMKREEELTHSLHQLEEYPDITFRLGGHDKADFVDRDLVLKGAGVPLDSPYIEKARVSKVPVDMSASLFARIADIPLVGVTGTRGKSTVTHLIEQILRADGRTTLLGGNVRGVSNLALLDKVTSESIGVFELDSWQCQGFAEEHSLTDPHVKQGPLSPQLAIFTTFMPDHMNYYDDSMERYLSDKAHIFLHQTPEDILVIGRQALDALSGYRKKMRAHVIVADEHDVPTDWKVPLPGAHNKYNVGVAVAAARAFGVDDATIKSTVQSLRPVPGRLEYLRTVRGIDIYNDNNATTPDATAAALEALDPKNKKNVILIAGGADKGLDVSVFRDAATVHAKACVMLPGTGTDKMVKHGNLPLAREVENLMQAAEAACDIAQSGDIVLFSPGFASFGLFKNEYDRGDQFTTMVREHL